MTHQNLNYWAQGPMNNWFINNAKDVVDAMEKSGRVLMHLSGHYHRGWFGTRNGISYVVAKGLVERPLPTNVCGIVSIDKVRRRLLQRDFPPSQKESLGSRTHRAGSPL